MSTKILTYSLALLCFLSAGSLLSAQPVEGFLQKYFPLSSGEREDLEKGAIVSRVLDHGANTEVALMGVTRLNVPKEYVVERVRHIKTLKKGKEVLQIGTLSKLDLEDVKNLTLDEKDLDGMQDCKVGDCDLKLPAEWIKQYQAKTDSHSKDYVSQANAVMRQLIVDYAKDYTDKGNKALIVYHCDKDPVPLAEEFQGILVQSTYLASYAHDFYEYLKELPDRSLENTESFLYWSKEQFGFRPVITVTDVTIHQRTVAGATEYLIASKQIFADHFYRGSLGLTFLMDDPQNSKGCLLIYINRSRIGALGGFLSGLRRAIAVPRIRKGLEENMMHMKDRLESDFKDAAEEDLSK